MDTKIKEFIEDYEIVFRWIDKNTFGLIDQEKNRVIINLYLFIAETFLHEYYHNVFPMKDERFVEDKAIKKIHKMKIGEIKELVDYFVSRGE